MKIVLKKDNFEKVEHHFVEILDNKDVSKNLVEIGKILSTTFNKKFEVNIIYPKRNDPLYIMSIFPKEDTLSKLVQAILNNEKDSMIKQIWDENDYWVVEIDNRIITGSFVEANSKELTALLLHECGHVIASNSIPYRMSKVMRYEYAKANLGVKNTFRHGVFSKLLALPILKACVFENYKTASEMRKELKADVFAIKMGYGKDLESVLDKIVTQSSINKSNASHIDQKSGEVYDRMKSDTLFSINTIENLKERKAKVSKENYKKMMIDLPSEYIGKFTKSINSVLFEPRNVLSSESVKESDMEELVNSYYEDAYMIEAFEIFKKKLKRIDPSIPDYIQVRKDSMLSNDDKLMLVSYIYSKLDLIDYYLTLMDDPKTAKRYVFKNSRNELIALRNQLIKARNDIMNRKIEPVKYGLQISYPLGYEQ